MKYLVFLAVIFFTFSATAEAQLCGRYSVTLRVHDKAFAPIKNTKIRIIPPAQREEGSSYLRPEHQFEPVGGRPGEYQITIGEGLDVADGYRVSISAKGYGDKEMPIAFPHCARITHDVTLLKPGELVDDFVSGTISDEVGDPVPYAEIYFVGGEDGEIKINADSDGRYELRLKPGRYRVEAEKMYFHRTRVSSFNVSGEGPSPLDIELQTVRGSDQYKVVDQLAHQFGGTVLDKDKRPVPRAHIVAIDVRGEKFRTQADADGKYSLGIPPGKYTLEAVTGMFKTRVLHYQNTGEGTFNIEMNIAKKCPACAKSPIQAAEYCTCDDTGSSEAPYIIDLRKKGN